MRGIRTILIFLLATLWSADALAVMYPSEPEAFAGCMEATRLNYEARIITPGATDYRCVRSGPNVNAFVGEIYQQICSNGCWYAWQRGYGLGEWPYVSFEPRKTAGPGACCIGEPPPGNPRVGTHAGNPINLATGNKYQHEVDLERSGLLAFDRHYNSQGAFQQYGLGAAWTHSYSRRIEYSTSQFNGLAAKLHRPTGGYLLFFKQRDGSWLPESDVFDTLVVDRDIDGNEVGWTYVNRSSHEIETYDVLGRLITISNHSGDSVSLEYNGGTLTGTGKDFLLTRVTTRAGRSLILHYDASARLDQLIDPVGRVTTYTYGVQGMLSGVGYPNSAFKNYFYNEPANTAGANLPQALTGVEDESGQRFATYKYDASGRAVSTEHAGGVERYAVKYGSTTATVTDPLGRPQYRSFETYAGVKKLTYLLNQCSGCPTTPSTYSFDANMHLDSVKDFNGYISDHDRGLDDLETQLIQAKSTPTQRTTQTVWNDSLRMPTERRTYDAAGALVRKEGWTYNSRGQVLTHSVSEP